MAEQPDETLNRRSASGILPCDGSIILRHDAYSDMRPFIERLWEDRRSMCCNIYLDQFPHGTNERGATKEEEDAFLLRYFSESDFRLQGGRFLKQVLYSIAKYNEDSVLSQAQRWWRDYNFHISSGMTGAQIRHILDTHQAGNFPDSFLTRVVLLISDGYKQFYGSQDQQHTASADTEPALPLQNGLEQQRVVSAESLHRDQFSDTARQVSLVPSSCVAESLAPTTRAHQQQQRHMVGPGLNGQIRYGTSLLHGQPYNARPPPRQPHKQEYRGRHRRLSGSTHASHALLGPMTPTQHMSSLNAPVGFPDFDPSMSDFVDAASFPMQSDGPFAPLGMNANVGYYSPSLYAPASEPRMPSHNANSDYLSMSGPVYHPGDGDIQFPTHQRSGSFSRRGSRPSFSRSHRTPRVVDPHSFSRFGEERFSQQRPYVPYSQRGGHRSSANFNRPRRSSFRSGDGWQGHRENRPFEGPQRRVHSDQRGYSAHASECIHETREHRSQSDVVGEHGYPLQRNRRQSHGFFHQITAPDDDNSEWACDSHRIGNRREDVTSLVALDLPPDVDQRALESYLIEKVNCERVMVNRFPTKTMIFANFRNKFDTQCALDRNDLKFDGTHVTFAVPFRFWKDSDSSYISPADAKLSIESGGHVFSNDRNHGSFFAGSHQGRRAGRSRAGSNTLPALRDTNDSVSRSPVFEDVTTSDLSDVATISAGYTRPILPSLSESADNWSSPSTPRAPSSLDTAIIEEDSVDKKSCAESRSTTSDSNKEDSSPKATEDADDSFQTAAETPEATKVFTPTPAEPPTETPTEKVLNKRAQSILHSPASITESDTTSNSTKITAAKSGPKQTESYSPFARRTNTKKKGKSKNKVEVAPIKQAKVDVPMLEEEPEEHVEPDTASGVDPGKSHEEQANSETLSSTDLPDYSGHSEPTILQAGNIVDDDKAHTESAAPPRLSTLSSMTALLTGALSSISTTNISAPHTEDTSSAPSKKPKKKKNKKKKAKATAPARDKDDTSTETLANEPPVASPPMILRENTNVLDSHLSGLGIEDGSIVTLHEDRIGYQATSLVPRADQGENVSLKSNGVEESRRRIQEMVDKERLLKQKK